MAPPICPHWSPPEHALQINSFGDGTDGRRIVLMATHPFHPYLGDVDPDPTNFEKSLQWLAYCYLEKLQAEFGTRNIKFLHSTWMKALDSTPQPGPHPISWWPLLKHAALASQDLSRNDDQTIVLVAGSTFGVFGGPSVPTPYPSGFGVRIVMRRLEKGNLAFAVTSMTAHLPSDDYSDVITGLEAGKEPTRRELREIQEFWESGMSPLPESVLNAVPRTANQEVESQTLSEVRVLRASPISDVPTTQLELVTYGKKATPLKDLFGFTAIQPDTGGFEAVVTRYTYDRNTGDLVDAQRVADWPLYSDAMVQVPVFTQEPTSKHDLRDVPTYEYVLRPSHEFDEDLREPVNIPSVLKHDYFTVLKCENFVKSDIGTGPYEVVLPPNSEVHPRSDMQSAISAYYAFQDFFNHVSGFGIEGKSLLRRVDEPIQVHYRSGIAPGRGKDGKTINARVALVNKKSTALTFDPPQAHVHLALANLNRWHRDVPDDADFAPRSAQPLGFANSRRWVLHEIAHVLIGGSLRELEFRFVHSFGDALSAVLCDPDSRIAKARPEGPWSDFRFQTFPWIFTTRRHNRTVLTGWSWSGTMHRDVQRTPELQLSGFKGYGTEQILSTTIFRLYRCLGGDTINASGEPNVERRRDASLVVVYFLLRATESFVHWPLRAEELESAMIDADVCLTNRLTSQNGEIWTGGQAHKVIRWAFEAQGMHPENPGRINNAIGAPPPVDIYIADQRDGLEPTFAGNIDHGPGSYVPVSLNWDAEASWTGGRISVNSPIVFGNRGTQNPGNVTLRGWFGWVFWNSIVWYKKTASLDITTHIDGAAVSLSDLGIAPSIILPFPQTLFLAEITCDEDRANTDPETLFSSAIPSTEFPRDRIREIIDLVATDNNLALFWLEP